MGKILVVDDELVICKSIEKIMAKEEHSVEYVLNAQDAIELLAKKEFDVVVTDLKMPLVSGMDLVKVMQERWPDIPVVMITGYATVSTAVQALQLGAFDYIPKPFTPDEMRSVASRAMERRRLTLEDKRGEGGAPTAFVMPDDLYLLPEHSWAKVENGHVLIGIDHVFKKTIGEVINIELPFEGDEIEQGKSCARVINFNRRMFNVWSPLGGQVIAVNYDLNKSCSPVNDDPYGRGWMIRLKPWNLEAEVKNLQHHTKS